MTPTAPCPCGSARSYAACCAGRHDGTAPAASAEALMRARYSAYVLRLEAFVLATWHASTRPAGLDLAADRSRWLGLDVRRHMVDAEDAARVEFVARYRVDGRGYRLHETSRFVRQEGAWYYLDGDFNSKEAPAA